jgi:hypothetical protein
VPQGPVEVVPAEHPRDTTRFVKAWWPIYEGDAHWVPPLIPERRDFFHPERNPYFKHADVRTWMAMRDGVCLGTIAATIDHRLQEHEPGVGLIGFFEFVDDTQVSRALYETAAGWLRDAGMTKVRGPFNFNTNHEFGLLIDGFDTDPCIANPHARPYYQTHFDGLGFAKVRDWYAYWLDKGPIPERVQRVSERFMKRNPDITVRKVDLSRWDEELELLYEVYNDAWENNWGHVHFNRDEFWFTAGGLKQILNPDLLWLAFKGDEIAGFTVTLPDFNQVAKKMNGRILPFGWWHYLTGRGRIDALRVFILGIKQKFQNLPIGAPLYIKTWEEGQKLAIRGAEASLILEDNHRMRGAMEKLGGRIYKTYRTYEASL